MRPDGSDARLVTATSGLFSWSPDGTSLAVAKAGMLVVVAADGSGDRTLTRAGTAVFAPMWSPDGTRIAFSRSGDGLFTIRADGSGAPTLVDAGGIYASWSPDGRLSATTGSGALVVYEGDGTSSVLAADAFGPVAPAWAPDGSRVAYLNSAPRVPPVGIGLVCERISFSLRRGLARSGGRRGSGDHGGRDSGFGRKSRE